MSTEEHKPVDLPQEEVAAPVSEPVVAESATAPVAETAAPALAPAVVAEPAPAEPLAADVTTPAPAAEVPVESSKPEEDKKEELKEELKQVEEGVLEHRKASGGFPKNLIYTKQTFWFGVEPVENKNLASYIKGEKVTETAFHNAAWATKTGSGLLFYGDKKDAISGVINLADSTEPEADGYAKFHFTCKGVKHTFKAPTKLDRDSWVAQLKSKIAEAKETIATVTESEEYKNAAETLKKPAIKKEDKSAEAPVDEAKKDDAAAGTEELPKDGHKEVEPVAADELAKHDDKKEDPKSEEDTKVDDLKEPKRRSTSRKRLSVFNFKGKGKKGEEKKEEASPTESAPAAAAPAAVEAAAVPAVAEATPVSGEDKPTEEAPAVSDAAVGAPVTAEEAAVVTPAATATATATEDKAAEEKTGEEKAVKPTPTKRNSFFDVFKSKKAAAPVSEPIATPEEVAETETAPIAPVTEVAPVIPPVDTATVPLPTAEEANPASPPVEGATEEPAASTSTPAEKKEMASDKRKSSMPFSLGKKDKSPSSPEEPIEKDRASPSLFSRFRKTIKGRPEKTEKSAEKSDEKADEAQAPAATGAPSEETPAPAAAVADPLVEETPAAVHEPEPIKSELPIAAPVGSAVA